MNVKLLILGISFVGTASNAVSTSTSAQVAYCGFAKDQWQAVLDFERNELEIVQRSRNESIKPTSTIFRRLRIQGPLSNGDYRVFSKSGRNRVQLMSFNPHIPGPGTTSPVERAFESLAYMDYRKFGNGGCDFVFRNCTKRDLGSLCLISYTSGEYGEGVCSTVDDSPECDIPAD